MLAMTTITDDDTLQRLHILQTQTANLILEINLQGQVVWANDVTLMYLSAAQQNDILGKHYLDILKPADSDMVKASFARALTGQQVKIEFSRADGGTLSLNFAPLFDSHRGTKCIMAVGLDVSELKKTEHLLFNAQKKYRSVIDNIPDMLFELDPEGRILFINRVLPGYSLDRVVGTPLTAHIPETDQQQIFCDTLKKVKDTGVAQEYELCTHLIDGRQTFWNSRLTPMFEDGKIKRLILLTQDITDKKRIEKEKQQIMEQLFQSQKLESLGKLAGGVAHEFNNLLAIILLHCTMLGQAVKNNRDMQDALNIIVKSSERAEELTTQLLGFARKGKYGAKPIALNPIIDEAAKLLGTSFNQGPKISLQKNLTEPLPLVTASESQVLQCLMNLGLNAVDAMPRGGEIRMTSYVKQNYVCIDVTDNGEGIAPEILPKIFDPFFTTKDIGKGTGLGLSMIYGIMENHGGRIDVESEPGKGSTFTLLFPIPVGESNYEKTKNSRRR